MKKTSKLVQQLAFLKKLLFRQEIYFRKDVNLPCQWWGSNYGGFYVYDRELSASSIVYSFGVGEDISFDEALIKNTNAQVFAFDPTPKSIEFIRKKNLPENYKFHPFGLSNYDGEATFILPEDESHVSCSVIYSDEDIKKRQSIVVEMKSISTILLDLNHTEIDLIKMDIEGAEYDVIEDILKKKVPVKQLLVEFHHRNPLIGTKKTKDIVRKLRENGYKIAAISDTKEEYTFVKTE